MSPRLIAAAMCCALASAAPAAAQTVVYGSGTPFTNSNGTFAADPSCAASLLLAQDRWCANNVRNSGTVGITTTYPRSGNGSMSFSGPASSDYKADAEIYFSTPFTLGTLTGATYDWYRALGSTAQQSLVPSLRFVLRSAAGAFLGSLVYEPVYNELSGAGGNAPAPTNDWRTSIIGSSSSFWFSGNGGGPYRSLSDWQTGAVDTRIGANTVVVGLSTGIGSGWGSGQNGGSFVGAVDNVGFTTSTGRSALYNFEVVPEPSTYALMGTGLLTLAGFAARRRRSA